MKDEYIWKNLDTKLEELRKELERAQKTRPTKLKRLHFGY